MENILVTEFSEFNEAFRENSIAQLCYRHCGSIWVLYARGSRYKPFTAMENILVTELSEFNETFRENSIVTDQWQDSVIVVCWWILTDQCDH